MATKVTEIMTRSPEYVEVTTRLIEAAQKMEERDIRHLPVLSRGELVGMLSERDFPGLATYVPRVGETRDQLMTLADRPVSDIMSGNVLSVDLEAEVDEVVDLIVDNKVGAIPVVDAEGQLRGIVSYIDVLRHLREQN